MFVNRSHREIYLYRLAVDMRKSIDGLSLLVCSECSLDPGNGTYYIFFNKGKDKLKILYYDHNGFCLWYKRLEKSRFKIPKDLPDNYKLDEVSLGWLLEGLDIEKCVGFLGKKYSNFC